MPAIVALCASHVTSPRRCRLLRSMIESVVAQTAPLPFVASVSFAEECETCVRQLKRRYAGDALVRLHLQPARRSQFQHYELLCDHVRRAYGGEVWCMFCDDDDFCHPDRCRAYLDALKETDGTDLSVHCGRILETRESFATEEVSTEYFTFCTRLTALERFCAALDDASIGHAGCDLLFSSVMWPLTRVTPKLPHWIYAYGDALGYECARYAVGVATFPRETHLKLAREFGLRWTPCRCEPNRFDVRRKQETPVWRIKVPRPRGFDAFRKWASPPPWTPYRKGASPPPSTPYGKGASPPHPERIVRSKAGPRPAGTAPSSSSSARGRSPPGSTNCSA